MQQLFETLKKMGVKKNLVHLSYEFVTLKEGAMASRKGNIVRYEDFRDKMIELAKIENIVAVKEASGSVDQISRISAASDITILSGDDSLTLPMMAVGAKGVVSVAGNVAPRDVSRMVAAYLSGNTDEARAIHLRLLPLFHVLFVETNPGPVKAAVRMQGLGSGELRLPLVPVSAESSAKVEAVLRQLELLG